MFSQFQNSAPRTTESFFEKDYKMLKLSEIPDVTLRNELEKIMSTVPKESKYQDYEMLNTALKEGKIDAANYLLDRNCAVKRDTKTPATTPLHHAVRLGDLSLVDRLLKNGALVTIVNDDTNSPLHFAFLLKHMEIVDRILVHIQQTMNYDDVSNKHGLTHFHIACARGNAQVAHDFEYTGADVTSVVSKESPAYPNYNCLCFACESKSIDTIEVVVRATDPPGSCMNDPPKGQAVSLKRFQDLGHILIKMHHIQDFSFSEEAPVALLSAFQRACFEGSVDEVKKFLEKGEDANTLMSRDASACPLYTPLHFAIEAEKNRQEVIELLLAHGADATLKNGFGMTPLHLALYNDRKSPRPRGKNVRDDNVLRTLYEAVKDKEANPIDMFGVTYFHVAVALGDTSTMMKFMEKGEGDCKAILPNCRNFAKYTPLHFAVKYGREDMAKLFIERGADVNANENESQFDTPLQVAIEYGQCGMVDFLLANGANPKVATYEEKLSTLHLLVERFGYFEDEKIGLLGLVETLVKHGVDVNVKNGKLNTPLHRACAAFNEKAELVYELLNWGADVNLKNWSLDTAFDFLPSSTKDIKYHDFLKLYEHVQKLKDWGLKVDSKVDKFCETIAKKKEEWKKSEDWPAIEKICSDEALASKQKERLDEIERLKNDMIDEKVSLHDFFKMDVQQAASYMENEKIKNLVSDEKCKSNYPNYGYLVKVTYHRILQWLAAQQPNKQNNAEESDVEMADVKRPLVFQKNSATIPPGNVTDETIPPNATIYDVIRLGNIQKVKEMLDKGASIKVVNQKKNSPLHVAFIVNNEEIVDLLLSHMKSKSLWINLKNQHGLAHLHIAASRGNHFAVQKLLEAKANPADFVAENSPIYPGYTALRFACDAKSLDTVKVLSAALNLFSNVSAEDTTEGMADLLDRVTMKCLQRMTQSHGGPISPFHKACLTGGSAEVEKFLKNGQSPNTPADRGSKMYPLYTALHFAVESDYDRQGKVEVLLKHGANVRLRNGFCMTPLHLLFYVDRKKDALEEYLHEREEDDTFRVLYEAVKDKEANLMDACGLTYFHIAAAVNDRFLVKRLLFLGEDVNRAVLPNARGYSKYTALHFAAEFGKDAMAKLLIDRGANVNANEDDLRFNTPLQTAIMRGARRTAEVLLDNGANAKVVKPAGNKTTIHLLVEQVGEFRPSSFGDICFGDNNVWLMEKLVSLGVDVDAKDSDGYPALHTACFLMYDHYESVEWLLNMGADINIKDKKGDTALDLAARGRIKENYHDFANLLQHVHKLKDLGLPVDPRNERFCQFVLAKKKFWMEYEGEEEGDSYVERMFSKETMEKKRQERLKEIQVLKEDMLADGVSMYDYLRMTPEQAAAYAKNERIQFIIEDDEPRVLYEIYGYLIPVVYRKSLKFLEGQGNADKKSGKKTHRGKRKRT